MRGHYPSQASSCESYGNRLKIGACDHPNYLIVTLDMIQRPASNYSIAIEKSIKHSLCYIFTKNSNHRFEISHTCVFDFAFSLQQTPFPLNLAHLISVNVKWKNKEFSISQI